MVLLLPAQPIESATDENGSIGLLGKAVDGRTEPTDCKVETIIERSIPVQVAEAVPCLPIQRIKPSTSQDFAILLQSHSADRAVSTGIERSIQSAIQVEPPDVGASQPTQ